MARQQPPSPSAVGCWFHLQSLGERTRQSSRGRGIGEGLHHPGDGSLALDDALSRRALRAINSYLQQLAGSEARKAIEVSVVVFDHAMDILLPMQPVSRVASLTQYPRQRHTTAWHRR